MITINDKEYEERKNLFERECDRVRPRGQKPLSINPDLRKDYRKSLVKTYNDLVNLIYPVHSQLSAENRIVFESRLVGHLSKLKTAFEHLNLNYNFDKNIYALIDIRKISGDFVSDHSDSEQSPLEDISTDIFTDETTDDTENLNTTKNLISPPKQQKQTENDKMANDDNNDTETRNNGNAQSQTQSEFEFFRIANQMINFRFSGDPLVLNSFTDALKLLKRMCKAENNQLFLEFIMTRLEGKAREIFDEEPPTDVDEIIAKLREKIKCESSKVIEGKILALRADRNSLIKFSEQAEKLAEQFERSLVVEGFSKKKAKEITIDKTVEMCRKSAKSDTVKAVLAASKFSEPNEVIAKMIVEINNLKADKPHTSYTHKYNNNNNHNRNSNGNNFNRNSNRNSNTNRNHSNNHNSHNNNNNNNFRQNSNNNSRPNNNNRSGHNSNGHYNNRNYNSSNQSNTQTVRYVSGNETHPGNSGLSLNQ